MGTVLQRMALNYGEREAIVFEGRSTTYRQFDQRVNRLANGLQAHGVGDGTRVAILSLNSPEFLEAYYACARLGAILCPVNYRLADTEIREILQRADPQFMIVDAEFAPRFWDGIRKEAGLGEKQVIAVEGASPSQGLDYESMLAEGASALPRVNYEITPSHPVAMLHTSGTTGVPKGALLTQANNVWDGLACAHHLPWDRTDRVLQSMPFMHCGGLHMLTPATLYQGLPLVIQRQWEPEEAIELIRKERCTSLFLQERILDGLIAASDGRQRELASLRKVLSAAGPATPEFIASLMHSLEVTQVNYGYGLTEAAPTVSLTEETGELLRKPGNVGRPVFFQEVRVVDENEDELPRGEVGELLVRGPNVFAGYHDMPEATEETLAGGWLRTGDLVSMDETSSIFFVDRKKDMIKTGGENVYPAEVEPKLREAVPEVEDLAIVGVPSARWGEEVVAIAVKRDGRDVDAAGVREKGRAVLGAYKLPKRVFFVDRLPKTHVGEKLQRQELRRIAEDRIAEEG